MLVLQTYTNEKVLLILSKTFKTLFGLIAFSYIVSRLSELNLQEYSFSFKTFVLISTVVISFIHFSFIVLIKNSSKKTLWELSENIILKEKSITFLRRKFFLNKIDKIEINIKSHKYKTKIYGGILKQHNGSGNNIGIYLKNHTYYEINFFLNNLKERELLKSILKTYETDIEVQYS